MSEDQVQVNVGIPRSLKTRLQHAAVDLGRPMSDLVTQAITELLDKINK